MNNEPHQFFRVVSHDGRRVWGVLAESGALTTVPSELRHLDGWGLEDFFRYCRQNGYTVEQVAKGRQHGWRKKKS